MSVIGSNILAGASGQAGAAEFIIERSLRFDSGSSSYLSRTPSSAGSQKTFTFSTWIKLSDIGTGKQTIFSAGNNSALGQCLFEYDGTYNQFWFRSSVVGGTMSAAAYTDALFRDPSAWYHLVMSLDTTQSTAADRYKLYVNGVSQSFVTYSVPQDGVCAINSATLHHIGRSVSTSSDYLNSYLAEVHFIDGQALAETDFGEYDDNNVWQPKAYSGTYGTNGFYLDFSDNSSASALGTDAAGSNDWTVNNLSVASGAGNDSLIDTPMNYEAASGNNGGNYATLNPLDGSPTGLSNGNLDASSANAYPTIIPGSGQWYYEVNGTGYTWDGTRANWTSRAGSHNFGQRPFSGTPASNHVSICTTNLPDPTIADGSTAFDVALDTGSNILSSTKALCNNGADFLWIKDRANASTNHHLIDIVRDTQLDGTPFLASNSLSTESALGTYSAPSGNSVGWAWDGGTSTVSNTDGTITTSVRANASAGFSIVSYAGGAGAGATIGHGLGAEPYFAIFMNRGAGEERPVYHKSLGNTKDLIIHSPVKAGVTSYWNNTTPTSSVITLGSGGSVNESGSNYIAWVWAPIKGFSAFGSYDANDSDDGPFVYTGFRSRLIIIKLVTETGANWLMFDTERDPHNVFENVLFANSNAAEEGSTTRKIDILSNGFKLRSHVFDTNDSSYEYIYAAWAEHPFKTARAR